MGWSCPPECICINMKVDCHSKGLDLVPDSVPLTTRELILTNNYFKDIPPLEITYLHELVYLDFSHNLIELNGEESFPAAEKLAYLDLSHNRLTDILPKTFSELPRLVFLNISSNPMIKKIHEDAFVPLTLLRYIDVSFCSLDILTVQTLDHLRNLHTLAIKGNPWDCNCTFLEVSNWLRQTMRGHGNLKPRIKLLDHDEITCKKPPKVEGWPIFKAEEEVHHDCLLHVAIADLLVLGVITFCIFIGGTVVAGLIGMTTVIYHHPVMKVGDESDDDDEYKIYSSNI
ncbi:leucine-rich repeat-containing protein 52-like [Pogona vitticeps]|uniref:Leucine-rich repeat-containing protein 52-like n=1 Tax=Pogona vitticeps TaxID=103695 RepID=A0A6J0T8H7_9SAUR